MIQDKEKWCYLAVTRLSALLRRLISTDNDNFCYLSCLYSLRAK